jgi:hypothetical protein
MVEHCDLIGLPLRSSSRTIFYHDVQPRAKGTIPAKKISKIFSGRFGVAVKAARLPEKENAAFTQHCPGRHRFTTTPAHLEQTGGKLISTRIVKPEPNSAILTNGMAFLMCGSDPTQTVQV